MEASCALFVLWQEVVVDCQCALCFSVWQWKQPSFCPKHQQQSQSGYCNLSSFLLLNQQLKVSANRCRKLLWEPTLDFFGNTRVVSLNPSQNLIFSGFDLVSSPGIAPKTLELCKKTLSIFFPSLICLKIDTPPTINQNSWLCKTIVESEYDNQPSTSFGNTRVVSWSASQDLIFSEFDVVFVTCKCCWNSQTLNKSSLEFVLSKFDLT